MRARTAKLAALGDVVVKLVQLAESAASACGVRDGGGRTIETPTCEDGTIPLAKRIKKTADQCIVWTTTRIVSYCVPFN